MDIALMSKKEMNAYLENNRKRRRTRIEFGAALKRCEHCGKRETVEEYLARGGEITRLPGLTEAELYLYGHKEIGGEWK